MNAERRAYIPRDVVMAVLLHLQTARLKEAAKPYRDAKYEVDGKERPLLVLTPPTATGMQQTLAFTSQRPATDLLSEFFCYWDKEGNQTKTPMKFGPKLGFKKECYLNISESHPYSNLCERARCRETTLDETLFDYIRKTHGLHLLGLRR